MYKHFQIAPEAKKAYHPGQFSGAYQKLRPDLRQRIADAVDALFLKKTGVKRILDEHNPADRVLVRQWLLIRDAIVSWYLYNQLLEESRVQGLRQQIEAGMRREQEREAAMQAERTAGELRRNLAESVERGGLPPELHGSTLNTLLQLAHITHMSFELIEIADALPHALHAAGPFMGYIAMPLSVVAGLMEVGEAHEAGDREAERNAFRYGFASQLVNGRISNALPSTTILGYRQLLGQKAAMRLLDMLKPDVRSKFLAVYRGPQKYPGQNMDRALHDVGASP